MSLKYPVATAAMFLGVIVAILVTGMDGSHFGAQDAWRSGKGAGTLAGIGAVVKLADTFFGRDKT